MKDSMTLEQFIPLVTSKPSQFIKAKNKGTIEIGKDADFVIWHPEASKMITAEDVLFRYKISPYIGQSLYGTVNETIVNGVTVYQNNLITNKNKGAWLLQK